MADTVTLNPGTGGSVVATDDIGSVHYQRVKIIHGVDGTNDGDSAKTNAFPVLSGNVARSTAAWTSATGLNTTLALTVTGYATVIFTLRSTTTITAGAITFEASDDNSNWYPIKARVVGSLVSHLVEPLSANDTESWSISVAGWQNFRLRLSTAITGSGTVTVALSASAASDGSNVDPSRLRATTATLSNVASSASNVTLSVANDNRTGWTVFNESTQTVNVKFGATASATSYTVQIGPNGYYEMPDPIYVGIIDAIWISANGSARITELSG